MIKMYLVCDKIVYKIEFFCLLIKLFLEQNQLRASVFFNILSLFVQPYNKDSLGNWFLEEMEDVLAAKEIGGEIDEQRLEAFGCLISLDDILKRKRLLTKIINRLVDSGELVDLALEAEPDQTGEEQNKILIVNPNCVIVRNEMMM